MPNSRSLRLLVFDKNRLGGFEDLQCDDFQCGILQKSRTKAGLRKIRFTRLTLS